ncbi:MAG TPA: NADH-quinone oxidoreductase subunit C, partial [Acidimicrobiales bacterium]
MPDETTTTEPPEAEATAAPAETGAEAPTDVEPTEPPGPTEPTEVDERHQRLLGVLSDSLGDALVDSHSAPGRALWVRVSRDAWADALGAAKGRLGCTFFDFLSAIDWLPSPWGRYEDAEVDTAVPRPDPGAELATGVAGGDTRIQVLCRVVDVRRQHAVLFKADLPDDDLRIRSLVPLYAGANWHERECWEMFGVTFEGHPGLRHLYLPGGFEGHPLRKDFPLLARLVKPWPGIVDVEPMPGGDGEGEAPGDAVEATAPPGATAVEPDAAEPA